MIEQGEAERYLGGVAVMIATPCYGGACAEPYMRSVVELVGYLSRSGIRYSLVTLVNESLITRARNRLVRIFLESDATHLFFVDSDIRFDYRDFVRMLLHDKDVVVGTYPMKVFDVDNMVGRFFGSVDEVRRAAARYVTNFAFADEGSRARRELQLVDGLVEVLDSGTGFMCIKRSVLEAMVERYPETAYQPEDHEGTSYALFDTVIRDGRYLSEDYAFCRRWQDMGGRVWLDPTVVLDHYGSIVYSGQSLFESVD
jgi:hypothetical protein